MVDTISLDKKLNEVLDKLQYLQMTISNLKDRDGALITEIGEVDERLFKEIADYENSIEELKKDFVLLLLEDVRKLANMGIINPGISEKNSEQLDKIESVLDFLSKHESKGIQKSKELQEAVIAAKDKLKGIRKDMKQRIMDGEGEDKEYKKTLWGHNQLGFA